MSGGNKNWQPKCGLLKQKVGGQQGEVSWARIQMDSALEDNRGLEAKAKMHGEQMAVAVKSAAHAVTAEHNTFKAEICGVLRRHGMESLVAPPFDAPHAPEPSILASHHVLKMLSNGSSTSTRLTRSLRKLWLSF